MHGQNDSQSCELADEAATRALGAQLAPALQAGLVIYLVGDLGAGKTTLVRGLLEAFGHKGPVKSPTYALIEPYTLSNLNLYHFDFYRFTDASEFEDAGLSEYFGEDSICLVEWPDKAAPFVPPADLVVELHNQGAGRLAALRATTERGLACLHRLT